MSAVEGKPAVPSGSRDFSVWTQGGRAEIPHCGEPLTSSIAAAAFFLTENDVETATFGIIRGGEDECLPTPISTHASIGRKSFARLIKLFPGRSITEVFATNVRTLVAKHLGISVGRITPHGETVAN
jgi:hypothetical protein